MLAEKEKRLKLEKPAVVKRSARETGTELRRHNKRAQHLGQNALYGKAAQTLSQSPTLYPATPGMLDRTKALHPTPRSDDPV